jgi:hypothetical protein
MYADGGIARTRHFGAAEIGEVMSISRSHRSLTLHQFWDDGTPFDM